MKSCKSGNAEILDRLELLDYIEMQDELIFMEFERQLEEAKERKNHER